MIEKMRSACVLRQIWADMFNENCSHLTDPDDEYLGLLMLLETALSRTKNISSNHSSLKSTCEKHLAELEWKAQECNRLKAEISRLESTKCHKCSTLETELLHYKKQSLEAQNRIKSIANILKLGDNIDDFQGQRKNSAMTLVSQMLFEESPKRKKRCTNGKSPTPKKINVPDTCGGVIPETDDLNCITSPARILEKTDIITSPGDENVPGSPGAFGVFNILKDRTSKSINLPVSSFARKSPRSVKKNLSANFEEQSILNFSPKKKSKSSKLYNDQLSLNGSLVDYVKEGHSELDKIWFGNEISDLKKEKTKSTAVLNSSEEVLSETPEQKVAKKSVWKMKESRGPAEVSGNKKLRQLRLNLSVKNKDVDLSSLDGYDGGSSTNVGKSNGRNGKRTNAVESDDIDTPYSADFKPASSSTQIGSFKKANLEPDDIDTPYSADFKPASTSTQKNEEKVKNVFIGKKLPLNGSKSSRSPNYKYKRDAVRKKEERMKLDGWDCEQCAKYYGAIGLSPSKMKDRMNKCSRHRDKFGKLNETPAGRYFLIYLSNVLGEEN